MVQCGSNLEKIQHRVFLLCPSMSKTKLQGDIKNFKTATTLEFDLYNDP